MDICISFSLIKMKYINFYIRFMIPNIIVFMFFTWKSWFFKIFLISWIGCQTTANNRRGSRWLEDDMTEENTRSSLHINLFDNTRTASVSLTAISKATSQREWSRALQEHNRYYSNVCCNAFLIWLCIPWFFSE